MAGDDDGGGTIIFIFIFLCCVISCTAALINWATGGSIRDTFSASAISKALAKINFTKSIVSNDRGLVIDTGGAYSYGQFNNTVTLSGSDLGPLLTGKSHLECDSACHMDHSCSGYTLDGQNCQLKQSTAIVKYKPGTSNLYLSADIGGVLYEYYPYQKLDDGIVPRLWSNSVGGLNGAISNCHTNKTVCNGFTWDGTTAVMYPQILAIDGTQPQTGVNGVYTIPTKTPSYINFKGQSYTDTPSTTSNVCPPWSGAPLAGSTPDVTKYFTNTVGPSPQCTNWSSGYGWDAGPDGHSQKYDGINYKTGLGPSARSNTITVADLTNCMNACYNNTWCQSIVYDQSVKSCYMRRDQAAWPGKKLDGPTQQICVPGGYKSIDIPPKDISCDCGVVDSLGGLGGSCNTNTIGPNSGKSDANKTSYVRLNPPLPQYCPQQCKNDVECIASWYDTTTGECNIYHSPPTRVLTGSSTRSTSYIVDNFPGP